MRHLVVKWGINVNQENGWPTKMNSAMSNSHDIRHELSEDLKIPSCYSIVRNERCLECLVHVSWLRNIAARKLVAFAKHERLSDDECQLLLQHGEKFSMPWLSVDVQVVEKKDKRVKMFPRAHKTSSFAKQDLNFCQFVHFVYETNYKNLWKDAQRRYSSSSQEYKEDINMKHQQYNDAVKQAIHRLYGCSIFDLAAEDTSLIEETKGLFSDCHGTLPAYCVVESTKNFYILQPHFNHTLRDCVTFSPAALSSSTAKPLFLIFQILQCVRDLHDTGLYLGDVTLSDIILDTNYWIQMRPDIWTWLESTAQCAMPAESNVTYSSQKCSSSEENHLNNVPFEELVNLWVHEKISNFDYLMALNDLAGRQIGNPNYHPIMPWIMDFTVPDGGWRDFTKSKFRLNKGDRQLDLTYEPIPTTPTGSLASGLETPQIPHHVSDMLSEITYYVYKARQTPKGILCRFVRSNWVPAEYPSSMQRLQEWTPDECIPEFFTDPSIFTSIHEDLPDLDVPWWSTSPEDFVAQHRAALESTHVSERLHHWIDLTFGYKLSGHAAIKAKNVCLDLVDHHTALSKSGVVQLFAHSHPQKVLSSHWPNLPPRIHRSATLKECRRREKCLEDSISNHSRQTDDGIETNSDAALRAVDKRKSYYRAKSASMADVSKFDNRPEHQTISLPRDYNPLMSMIQLETLYNFTNKAIGRFPPKVEGTRCNRVHSFHQRRTRDMVTIGCLLSEIFIAPKLRAISMDSSLEDRFHLIRHILGTELNDLPRCVRKVVRLLLQIDEGNDKSNTKEFPLRYPAVTSAGLPPPSAHQLLLTLAPILSFPNYFKKLYTFICELRTFQSKIERLEISMCVSDTSAESQIADIAATMVQTAAFRLPELLPLLDEEGLDLLIPYLRQMFEGPHTAILAAWQLFDEVARALGPSRTAQTLLAPLVRLFDTDYPTAKHIKLFHRSYLLKMIIRLNLQTCLAHFTILLIEAVGGHKDFGKKVSVSETRAKNTEGRKTSHMHTSDLQNLSLDEATSMISPFNEIGGTFGDRSEPDPHEEHEGSGMTPEVFVFEALSEDVAVDISHKPDIELDLADNLEQKFGDSSDSASGDGMSIGESNNIGCSPVQDETEFDEMTAVASSLPDNYQSKQFVVNADSAQHSWDSWISSDTDFNSDQTVNKNNQTLPNEYNISDAATETVLWLSHRLGPVLTAKHLTRNLLCMLIYSYLGEEQLAYSEEIKSSSSNPLNCFSSKRLVGDQNSMHVLECLTHIAALYGEQFILLQYLPSVLEVVTQAQKRLVMSCEAGLAGSIALIHHIVPYLSNATLMDHLQDTLIGNILSPIVNLVGSTKVNFPCGGHARKVIAWKLLHTIYLIGLRIGFEMTRKHLTSLLQQYFGVFSRIYYVVQGTVTVIENVGDALSNVESPTESGVAELATSYEELTSAFTPEMAYIPYVAFCKLAGSIHMEQHLANDDLIRMICLQYEQQQHLSDQTQVSTDEVHQEDFMSHFSASRSSRHNRGDEASSLSFGCGVTKIGNRIDVPVEEELVPAGPTPVLSSPPGENLHRVLEVPKCDISKLVNKQMENDARHLKGNWLAYWEHEIGRSDKDLRFNFKQIKLQTFVGHSNTVRSIYVLNNENSFISASKDKTVKLWSLRSHGDGSVHSQCQWTYNNHRKSVFSVTFLESLRLVGSCDSTVHIWDPFLGSCLRQFDCAKSSPVTVLTSMPPPSTAILTATAEATIRFLDVRTLRYVHEYKASLGSAGLIRCITTSPNGNWVAIGHSSGIITILDVRTGLMSSTWKGHEGEILQIKAFNNNCFVTSSLDQSVSVWNADDGKLQGYLRGPTESVHCFSFYRNEMISATMANRIGVHTSVSSQASFYSTRLRADTFKGAVTSLSVLPLNRLLLLGADNGTIRLLC